MLLINLLKHLISIAMGKVTNGNSVLRCSRLSHEGQNETFSLPERVIVLTSSIKGLNASAYYSFLPLIIN